MTKFVAIKSVGENKHTGVIYRLKRNKPALAGGFFLALAGVCALFAYGFIPDNSRDANMQDIQIIALPPLAEVLFWEEELEKSDGCWWWINGRSTIPKRLALSRYRLDPDSLHYLPFSAPDVPELWQSLALKQHPGSIIRKMFWLGTDVMGRDMLSRLMLGLRVSLSVGFIAVLISLVVGVGLGMLAGYYRGWLDQCVGWLINVIWSIPSLLLVIAISLAMGKGLWQLFLAVGLTMWVDVARVVRGQVMALREREFVVAARAMGFSDGRIMLRHLLPNLTGPLVIMAASNFATAILVESGLSFLGLGVQPPVASLGMMIKEHYPYIIMDAAYMALIPGLVILLLVLAFNLFGNGLSDAFDSKIKIS